ncbi:UNVERIFIED_CONTAM: hypothetical protein NCL1_18854 [Trichonephila clavipes]
MRGYDTGPSPRISSIFLFSGAHLPPLFSLGFPPLWHPLEKEGSTAVYLLANKNFCMSNSKWILVTIFDNGGSLLHEYENAKTAAEEHNKLHIVFLFLIVIISLLTCHGFLCTFFVFVWGLKFNNYVDEIGSLFF